jgi:indole-3-glycerol phosphate synthase
MSKPILIAEVKTESPFGFKSGKTWEDLFQIANQHGDWISIHTDSRWGGDFELIKKAKSLTDKPILAKGIHATDEEVEKAFLAGADYCLVVGRMPDVKFLDKCLIEPNTIEELVKISTNVKCVWNSRDLNTGGLKAETFEMAREAWSGWLCQASNIKSQNDVKIGANAILVGQGLPEFVSSVNMVRL